ncbi:MAG: hypothetical protein CSB01_00860 [Bacteroidia bacterium]|nr:MAG: hypothetical protein CSB01_00860 [Bacteroidia bacterium]
MLELYIVRHGETHENAKRICQGQSEGVLSEKGIRENRALALQLSGIRFDAAYCSTLRRARLSCETILEQHPPLHIHFDPRLMEWHMGELQGKNYLEDLDLTHNPYKTEPFEAVRERCLAFLNDLFNKQEAGKVLIVSHGLTIKMLESILLAQPFASVKRLSNSCFRHIKLEKSLSKKE